MIYLDLNLYLVYIYIEYICVETCLNNASVQNSKERTCCSKAALVTSTSCDRSSAAVAGRTSHLDLQGEVRIRTIMA